MERTRYAIARDGARPGQGSKKLTHGKIRPETVASCFGHRDCYGRRRTERNSQGMVNTNTLGRALGIAAAMTLLSLTPRESFAQG